MTTPHGQYKTVGITGIGTGFDFSQVTGMVETFKNAELVNPETLYPPGSFGSVTDMRGCWYNPLASGPHPGHSNSTFNISGEPYALPTMNLSSVTDIRSGFSNFARYNAVTPDFLSGLDLSSVAGHGLDSAFDGAFSLDPLLSYSRSIIMPDLGLSSPNSLTSLNKTFRDSRQLTGISLFNTSNVTNFDRTFKGVFSGRSTSIFLPTPGIVSGAPLNVRDGVTGLVFPAFDMSAGTGFYGTFEANEEGMGFMSRDFSSAVSLNSAWKQWYLTPATGNGLPARLAKAQMAWAMPDTPSGHFPTISVGSVRSMVYAFSNNFSFEVFPEIDFSTAWTARGAFYGASAMKDCRSWNFASIDASEAWLHYPGNNATLGVVGGATQMFNSCELLTGFSNGLHLGSPTGLISTFGNSPELIMAPDLTSRGGSLSNVQSYSYMFHGCPELTGINFDIDLTSADSSSYYGLSNMFWQATKLRAWKPFIGSAAGWRNYHGMYNLCSTMGSYSRNGVGPRTYESCHAQQDLSDAWDIALMFRGCQNMLSLGDVDCSSIDGSHGFPDLPADYGGGHMEEFANGCSKITGLNLTNTSNVPDANLTFANCWALTCINTGGAPIDFTSVKDANMLFYQNYLLGSKESFPAITFEKCGDFRSAFRRIGADELDDVTVHRLRDFPSLDYGTGLNGIKKFGDAPGDFLYEYGDGAWQESSIATFGTPLNNSFDLGRFDHAWSGCRHLTTFPANVFDNNTGTGYYRAFNDTSLGYASIENIVVSIDTAGVSNGALGLTNFSGLKPHSNWTAAAKTSLSNLLSKGWSIEYTT